MTAPKRGDLIRRLIVGPPTGLTHTRLFRLTLVNKTVFSAESADGEWSGWGGPIQGLREGDTFEFVKAGSDV
jgi:hypothetical protein